MSSLATWSFCDIREPKTDLNISALPLDPARPAASLAAEVRSSSLSRRERRPPASEELPPGPSACR